eukprot:TRINITY_DN7308_c0_g3_i2.p3 TRINITY_DN7308_c0_g3~~TRINITY_DN7308_c0_g3_i2.p3  ORF type:complete len:204 (+),score=85.06 TRINITY_DN7308_c0_g3_i2:1347-1958(+)
MRILFPNREAEWEDILEMSWLDIVVSGIRGLEHYNPEKGQWMQAHVNAGYVILKVLLEAGEGLVKIELCKKDGKDYVEARIDRTKIKTVGKEVIGKFLKKLHVFRSMGDLQRGKELFDYYSKVDENMLKIREVALMYKVSRRLELQGNLRVEKDGSIKYVGYEKTLEGVIQSFVERYDCEFDEEMYSYWKSCRDFFNPLCLIH